MPTQRPGMRLALVAGHLNSSVGPLVSEQDLASALQVGSLSAASEKARPHLSYLFVESSMESIMACMHEAGATLQSVNLLYQETLEQKAPRVTAWEDLVKTYT